MRPRYVTIMSGLDDKSLGQVQAELQTLKIPNQINGTSIAVPSGDANTARVQLSMAGLPQSGYIGYGSVSSSFGMTQDQFNIQVLDALQQSLNQTIESINGIEGAQVHIVMPTSQLFVSQPKSTAKASVFVQVGNGVTLTATQVAGIQQLVAHSVKGLSTSEVTVVDQNGVTLSSDASTSPVGAGGSSEVALRQQMENEMTQKLTDGLNRIVGVGNAVVVVHADVTFNQVKTQSHVYSAAPGQTTGLIHSSETTQNSSSQSNGNTVGGVAGQSSTNPNTSSYAGAGQGSGASNSTSTTNVVNYDNSWQDTTTVSDPIQPQGYQVGVFLNADDKQLTPAIIKQIKAFVQNAVGASGTNANSVSVSTVPFTKQSSSTAQPLNKSKSQIWMWGGAAGFAALVGTAEVLRRRRKREAKTMELPRQVNEMMDETPMTEDERMKDELSHLASKKPDDFANLLRTWLAE